jgi:hypothetical protein
MKPFLLLLFALFAVWSCLAQTFVSGGIYANTTWSFANSPYIVTGNVVVFPGDTLTIEPGVTVKFDSAVGLELRSSLLIALGTATDSITFTSNSANPIPGIWGDAFGGGIWLSGIAYSSAFNYCKVEYSRAGINNFTGVSFIRNSTFLYNVTGLRKIEFPCDSCVFKFNSTGVDQISNSIMNYCIISNNTLGAGSVYNARLRNCFIDSNQTGLGGAGSGGIAASRFFSCSISHNQTGIYMGTGPGPNYLQQCTINDNSDIGIRSITEYGDSIISCEIRNNGTGIKAGGLHSPTVISKCDIEDNGMGIVASPQAHISCNKICNNAIYNLQLFSSNPLNVSGNYWCTTDSTNIASTILDGYDSVAFGLVTFLPVDSVCYLATGVTHIDNNALAIFPNPTTGELFINSPEFPVEEIDIFNSMGAMVYSERTGRSAGIHHKQMEIVFPPGIYLVKVLSGERQFIRKLVVR